MSTVAFHTLGCKVNHYETDTMWQLFKKAGYERVDFDDKADVYVINTCTVTNTGDKKSRQVIRRAVRRNPDAVIAVTGCYAQTSPDEIVAIPGVDVVVGTQGRDKLLEHIEEPADARTGQRREKHYEEPRIRRIGRSGVLGAHAGVVKNSGRVQQLLYVLHHSVGAGTDAQSQT